MKRILLLIGVLTLCLTALAPQSSVEAAAQVLHIRGSDQVASATFSRIEGTLVTSTTIVAIHGIQRALPEEPNPTPYLSAVVMISQHDTATCQPEDCPITMFADGFTETPDFRFNRNLSSADLKATVMMTDMVFGRSFPLGIELSWIGIGETRRNFGSRRFREPGIIITTTGQNYLRLAEVSGSVIDLSTNFDFASQATALAFLERAFGNEIRIEIGR